MARIVKDFWKSDENSWNFWRKSTGICRKMKDHQNFSNGFHRAGKYKKAACKTLSGWTKNEDNFENFPDNFEIFWSVSMENWLFHRFYQIFLGFLPPLRKYPWKITPDFYNNFSDFFWGGDVPAFPRLPMLVISSISLRVFYWFFRNSWEYYILLVLQFLQYWFPIFYTSFLFVELNPHKFKTSIKTNLIGQT